MKQALIEEEFSGFNGKYYNYPPFPAGGRLMPKAVQRPHPPIVLPLDSQQGFVPMGEMGYRIAIGGGSMHNQRGDAVLKDDVENYRQAWRDAGELYGIRTPQMDEIANLCRACDGVMGVKVMGAGFGGNLLALVRDDCLEGLQDTLEEHRGLFSRPVQDSILVHNPGQGVSIMSGPEGDMNWSPLWPTTEV